jgi:RNA-directed DNA polymerase
MPPASRFFWEFASALLDGRWSRRALLQRALEFHGLCPSEDRVDLAGRAWAAYPDAKRLPDDETLASFLQKEAGLPSIETIVIPRARLPEAGPWATPRFRSPGHLAEWLGLSPNELDWFADLRGRESDAPDGPLRHYHYRWLPKRSGAWRLLEIPKARLKAIQRRLLHEILERIPVHDAAHGYRRGRSVATYVTPHAGQQIVLRFDLRDFFPSVCASRVCALFRTAGYPLPIARLLTGLCTNVAPDEVCVAAPGSRRYAVPHLPQGAPTSPALANLCAFRFDRRLSALAESLEARYTRYADDLAFSGGETLERAARRVQVLVCRIALEEGFEVHTRKSRFMRRAVRQQLAGVVVNAHPNVSRDEYDRLKAILTNCVRHGPTSQNRAHHADFRGHLLGRIAYVAMLNPTRAIKLREIFRKIRWDI